MKIVLDLKHSYNNYHWKDKEELKDYIEYMKNVLWSLQDKMSNELEEYIVCDNEENRLYDILDMFSKYELIGEEKNE